MNQLDSESVLTPAQIQSFLDDGVLVVDHVLSDEEVVAAQVGLRHTLHQHGIDTRDLDGTGHLLRSLSSTNGSGGVLDLFYDRWKLRIATHEKLFRITQQLWAVGFCHAGETREDLVARNELFRFHPYGSFDCRRGYVYIDRIGYRIPTRLAEKLGSNRDADQPRKPKRASPLQRSLTPHLDCCPDKLYDDRNKKWRPIQCFVSLTDNIECSTGGFEAAKGHHRIFDGWTKSRAPTIVTRRTRLSKTNTSGNNDGDGDDCLARVEFPAPCVGEYTHIRPVEDRDVIEKVAHVPVRAGSAVFWDNRIPHANSYRHEGIHPRAVIYCSFLPDTLLNRQYVKQQLSSWQNGLQPGDQWTNRPSLHTSSECCTTKDEPTGSLLDAKLNPIDDVIPHLTSLGRRLLAIDSW